MLAIKWKLLVGKQGFVFIILSHFINNKENQLKVT